MGNSQYLGPLVLDIFNFLDRDRHEIRLPHLGKSERDDSVCLNAVFIVLILKCGAQHGVAFSITAACFGVGLDCLTGSFRKRGVCSTKLRQRYIKQRSTSSRRKPAKSPCSVGAFQTQPARGEFGSVETSPTRGANGRRTEQAASTQHTKRAAGTRSPRSNPWLRCRAFLDRHQDQYAIDGNAAGDLRDRA